MKYEIVYDERYIAPGYIIYRQDYKQFLKIIPSINDEGNAFTFIASDEIMDNTKESFRHILFEMEKDSLLSIPLLQLKSDLGNTVCFSIYPKNEGYNQLRVEETEDKIILQITKDLTHSLNLDYNAISVTVAGPSIGKFYTSLKNCNIQKDVNKVLEKMVNLTPIR